MAVVIRVGSCQERKEQSADTSAPYLAELVMGAGLVINLGFLQT